MRPKFGLHWAAPLGALLLAMALSGTAQAERPAATKLLPESTIFLASVPSVPDLCDRFLRTSYGRMGRDPQVKPLISQFLTSLTAATGVQQLTGLSLTDLLAIPQGEITLAVVAMDDRPPALVVLLDAGSQLSRLQQLVRRGTEALEHSGAVRAEENITGTKLVIYSGVGMGKRTIGMFEKDATLVAGSDPAAVRQVLGFWNGQPGTTLAANEKFAAIMQRCVASGEGQPQASWYFDPLGLMRTLSQSDTGMQVTLAMLPVLGLDGLDAVGGSMAWDTSQFDALYHAHLLLSRRRAGVLEIVTPASGETEPEAWVPGDAAAYTTVHWQFDKSFRALVKVYDGFRGDGALSAMLKQSFSQPMGLDVETELLPNLEGRVTLISRVETAAPVPTENRMAGFRLKDPAPVRKALERIVAEKAASLSPQSYAGKTYWEITGPQTAQPAQPQAVQQPRVCFGMLDDYLLVADGSTLYRKALDAAADRGGSLAQALDYKLIASKIRRQAGGTGPAMVSFSRPEQALRMYYGLLASDSSRKRWHDQAARNPFLGALDATLTAYPLPPFAALERYVAPGGSLIVNDDAGLHYIGFSLRRKAD